MRAFGFGELGNINCGMSEDRTKSRKSGEIGKFFGELMATAESAYNVVRSLKNPELCHTAKFVKAVTYAHNQREKFERIMEDGNIPLDNSEAERSTRDFAVLRHSTPSGFGSVKGAKSAAILSSFHETCKKFGLRLSEYMEFLFRKNRHVQRYAG